MPDLFSSILINLSGLTDLTNISLTAAIVVSLLLGREKKTHTWLMICGVTSLLCVLVCFFILDVSANSDWVPVQFLFIILTLGFLILFPYHFPFFDPANRWPARIALAAAVTAFLLGILATVSWYLSLIAPMTIRFIFNGIFILEYFYLIANLLMQTVRLSRSNTGNDPLRTSQQGILSALMRPVGRYAKATRAFTLVILSPLLVAFLTLAYYAELIPYGVFLLIFDYGFLVCLFAFMMIYLNYSVEQTTFLVKLVLSTLVIVLVVVNIMYSITLSGHIESYMAARSADVRMVEKALMKTGPAGEINPDDVPSSVQFVVSRSLTNTGRGMQYTPHIVRDAGFSLAYANRKGLETLPTVLFIRAGDSDSSMYSIFKFDARERKYIVGFALSGYREVLHPYTLPIMLLILGSTLAVMLILPLFFRISLIRPLDNLLEGVRLLDEGQMNINLNVQYNDEIGYLTSAFNRMVSSLSKAEELKAIQQELEMARQIQTGLLPKEPP
ncbi:MAG TPA: HAMP domain-containing protein, partial [Spirochaetota bacterium]|nr:HAMP domain-containing protein [Spirochaetota bacterium]